jgi:endonuclease/exonuclease/phosphatase family metal-dependent hydrolase
MVLFCLGFWVASTSFAADAPQPKAPIRFRAMTYNIHHGEGTDGKIDLQRIADLIRQEQADLVALQEVDKGVRRTQQRDFPSELAALTGMSCVFSNNFSYQGGEYGNAVLSRFPVLGWTNTYYRMLRTNEQRGALQVKVLVANQPLVFMATHVDFRPDDAERRQNAQQLAEILDQYPGLPVMIGGDFNDVPDSRLHQAMKERWQDIWEKIGTGEGFTIPSEQPTKRIDYLWITPKSPWLPRRAWVPKSDASDHLPLVVEFERSE